MSLPVKRSAFQTVRSWALCSGGNQAEVAESETCRVKVSELNQLEACLLNTQRTVQAFRDLLAVQRSENAEIIRSLFLRTLQRDNARAALAEAQKLNATLREERDHAISWDNYGKRYAKQLRAELAAMTAERNRAIFYAKHRAMECAQMENADAECTCGLTELRNKVKEETK